MTSPSQCNTSVTAGVQRGIVCLCATATSVYSSRSTDDTITAGVESGVVCLRITAASFYSTRSINRTVTADVEGRVVCFCTTAAGTGKSSSSIKHTIAADVECRVECSTTCMEILFQFNNRQTNTQTESCLTVACKSSLSLAIETPVLHSYSYCMCCTHLCWAVFPRVGGCQQIYRQQCRRHT